MIPITNDWKSAIENIYRNPAYFKFTWLLESNLVFAGSVKAESEYSPVLSVIDTGLKGDYVASTEEGRWLLDGRRHAAWLDNTTNENLYSYPIYNDLVLNNLSDEAGNVNESVKITWEEDKRPSTNVLNILWDTASNTYATNFTVTVSSGGTKPLAISIDVTNNQSSISRIDLNSFDKIGNIIILVKQWSRPNCKARISEIVLGEVLTQDDVNVTGVDVSKEISILSTSIPQYKCTVNIDNTDHIFDPLRKEGISTMVDTGAYFLYHWELSTLTGDILTMPEEVWRVLSYEIPSDSSEVSIQLGTEWDFMSGNYYPYRVYGNVAEGSSLAMYVSDVLTQSRELTQVQPHLASPIPSGMQNILNLGVPMSCSYKEALQYMSMPAEYYLMADYATGSVKIRNYNFKERNTERIISKDQIISKPKITLDTPIKTIYINKYDTAGFANYYIDIDSSTLQPENFKSGDEVIIDFGTISLSEDEVPSNNIIANRQYNLVGIVSNIYGNGVVLDDVRYSSTFIREVRLVIKGVTKEDALLGCKIRPWLEVFDKISFPTNVRDKDADFVTIDNSLITEKSGLLNKCNDFLQKVLVHRYLMEFDYIGFPELEPGDIITVDTEYGNHLMVLTKVTLSFNGGFSGTVSGRLLEDLT